MLELAALVIGAAVANRWSTLAMALLSGAAVWFAFLILALLGGTMGFADVQLAGLVGLVMGWVDWRAALAAGAIMLMVGGVWALVLLLRGRRGTFAYAPALLLGAGVAVVVCT